MTMARSWAVAAATFALVVFSSSPAVAQVVSRGYIPVRDGVELQYSLQLPSAGGNFGTVVIYNPYEAGTGYFPEFLSGYAVISVNVRGTGCSGGTFRAFDPIQAKDGYDIVEWIAQQPWSNGRVGMADFSYGGITQLMTAGMQPPHLKAIAPGSTMGDLYRQILYPGGIPNGGFGNLWYVLQNLLASTNIPAAVAAGDTKCAENFAASTAQNPPDSVLAMLQNHPFDDAYMKELAPNQFFPDVDVPTLLMTQWQDEEVASGVADDFHLLNPANTWMVLSNGEHEAPDWGTNQAIIRRFMDWALDEQPNGFDQTPHVQVWMEKPKGDPVTSTAEPRWTVDFAQWPPPRNPLPLHLRAGGLLSFGPATAGEASSDNYEYPRRSSAVNTFDWPKILPKLAHWVRTPGTAEEFDGPAPEGGAATYTTAPWQHDRLLAGASLDFWMKSTATDTDLQATLTEVRPDGQERYIQRGWLRASHRKLDPARSTTFAPYHTHQQADAEPLQPGQPTAMRLEIDPFVHMIREGSSLRLTIEAPRSVTGTWSLDYIQTHATNSILHDPAHPSKLVVGVVPGVTPGAALPPCDGEGVKNQPCRTNEIPVPAADDTPEP
jgi:putative CocE/NonD family hydrolase